MNVVNAILKCHHLNESYRLYFPIMLFATLYQVVLTFESVNEILKCHHQNQTKATNYFPVVLFIILYLLSPLKLALQQHPW